MQGRFETRGRAAKAAHSRRLPRRAAEEKALAWLRLEKGWGWGEIAAK